MPLIEYKNLERLHSEDRLLDNAGYLLKAGMKIGEKAPELAKHNTSVYRVIKLTKEEMDRAEIEDNIEERVQEYISHRNSGRITSIVDRLRETVLSFYSPFNETQQIFSIPGKKSHLEMEGLLENKLDSLYRHQVEAGASRIISKYKYSFAVDMLKELYEIISTYKYRGIGEKPGKGKMPRVNFTSIRLNSKYDGGRFSMLGDSLANQAVDTALTFMYVMTNINKERILQEAPLTEARFDPDRRTTAETKYQYRPEMIIDAAAGILLHNIGFSHTAIHELITPKPVLLPDDDECRGTIRKIQRSINVAKHLVDNMDISSLAKMMIGLQRDYADGTGFPYLNENKNLHEFLRLFHIIKAYDSMTNPVISPSVYSRNDVLAFLQSHSGPYIHNPDKFTPSSRFDSDLTQEFCNMISPYETGEKVYLYKKSHRNQHLFVGKVHSYLRSYIPVISILKDEKNNKEYRDGDILISINDGVMFVRNKREYTQRKLPWISDLEILDKGIDPGNIEQYMDPLFGKERTVSKHYR